MFKRFIEIFIPPFVLPIEASSAIIKNSKSEYLLLKRSNKSKSYQQYWQLPEGKIGTNENPKQTILRELEEEIGHKYKPNQIKFVEKKRILVKKYGLPILFIDRYLHKAPNLKKIVLSEEHTEHGYFSKNQIIKLPNTLPGLEELLKGK